MIGGNQFLVFGVVFGHHLWYLLLLFIFILGYGTSTAFVDYCS